ncbi:MAG TPA: DUF4157 domain-containing protein, partial [Pyrinomonadaceae bacterium]|nr:DUF4157 domain-containing protein [Pyrinomonadaceae bacterium]
APLDRWQRECAQGVGAPQPKLSSHAHTAFGVSRPDSPAELEADEVAASVSQGWTIPAIQESAPQTNIHRSSTGPGALGVIPGGNGMPLPVPAREFFETSFGRSFHDVRVHTDAPAARSASSLQADAFTLGRDIYFGAGKFDSETPQGRRLIAHELTHTIQQHGAAPSIMRQATPETSGATTGPTSSQSPAPAPSAAPAAASTESSGPGAYDGCPDPQPIIAARNDAATKAAHAAELLNPANLQSAAPLLARHFHVDASRPESQATVTLIRDQFTRMASGLNSGIRIFCRSAPRIGQAPPSRMPVAPECARLGGSSTSCANNDASATVEICELRIVEGGDSLVKTLLHEFAHVACNGNPAITSGGAGETYYGANQELPLTATNVLTVADSYAWFAMDASSIQVEAQTTPDQRSGRSRSGSRLPWLGVLGVGVGLGIAGIWAPGLLVGGALGLGIGIAGLAGAFE